MNEKINTDSFLSVERIRRQIERYTNQMKENLAAGGNRAVMAVKGSPVVVTDMSEENRKKLDEGRQKLADAKREFTEKKQDGEQELLQVWRLRF